LPPPKIYRGPSGEENAEEDAIDSDISVTFTSGDDVNPNCSAFAADSFLASDVVNKNFWDLQLDSDCAETSPARQLGSTAQDGFDAGECTLMNAVVTARTENHCGEGSVGPLLPEHGDNVDHLSKYKACDRVDETEIISSADQPSGDVNVDISVREQCKELDTVSNDLPPSREKSVSPPINIPGSNVDGVVDGGDGSSQPQCLGSISEDSTTPTPLTSDEVGSGGSAHFPSFYWSRKKSVPRFTPRGSFIIPADEDIYVDLSCNIFSTDPSHLGRVQDISALPSPPERAFTIGDNDQADLVYYAENESVASELTVSGQSFRSQKTTADTECQHSDGEVIKKGSSSFADIKVEMVDATSREVLDEIFKRTSGEIYCVVL